MANGDKSIKELKIEIKGLKQLIKELREDKNHFSNRVNELYDQIDAMRRHKIFHEQYYKISYTAKAIDDGPQIPCDAVVEAYTPQIAINRVRITLKIRNSFQLKNIEKIDV